jgi:hypothetical protein
MLHRINITVDAGEVAGREQMKKNISFPGLETKGFYGR